MIVSNLFRPSLRSLYNTGKRFYCCEIDPNKYQKLSNETLESLNDRFSELIEDHDSLMGADTNLADGVLTVKLNEHGTYVINKQTPNQQIWLSSPVSGPYRFDIIRVRFLNIAIKLLYICFSAKLGLQTHGRNPTCPVGQRIAKIHSDRSEI